MVRTSRGMAMTALATVGIALGWQGMARGDDYYPGPAPTCDISCSPTTLYAGQEATCSLSNWQDTDYWLFYDYPFEEGDDMGNVDWSIVSGPGSISGSGSQVTLTAGSPQVDTSVTVQAVVHDSGTHSGAVESVTKTVQVNVTATRVGSIQRLDGVTWVPVPASQAVVQGGSITFKAIPSPSTSPFPAGKPVWGGTSGASGTGAQKAVTFADLGTKTVTATSVNTVTANVLVSVFAGKLTPTDNFHVDRSHTRVGVGETGTLGVDLATGTTLDDLKPLTWTRTAGTTIAISNVNTDTGTADFTAGDTAEDTTFTLTDKNSNSVTYTVTVVAPTGAYQIKGSEGQPTPGTCSAYMRNYTYLLPKDVSFSKIEVGEGTCEGEGTGSSAGLTGLPHPAWGPVSVSEGDIETGCLVEGPNAAGPGGTTHAYDYVSSERSLDVAAGTFEWNIPWEYSIGEVEGEEFTRLLHRSVYDGQQTVTITKGGASTTHTGP